jgi:hypothetical protein
MNKLKIFLAGVIQGSNQGKEIHSQDYRTEIKALVSAAYPQADIFDPFDGHEYSIDYDDEMGKQTFHRHLDEARSSDLLIAYLPHASLGTAIEIWESHLRGIPVWIISPMSTNWVVRFCSNKVFDDIASFANYLKDNPGPTPLEN